MREGVRSETHGIGLCVRHSIRSREPEKERAGEVRTGKGDLEGGESFGVCK